MPQDGDVIMLPMGWKLELSARDDEYGSLQGFVTSPDGQESASITAALGMGITTGQEERKIPAAVLQAVKQYEGEYA
jgi:hypothetical protein